MKLSLNGVWEFCQAGSNVWEKATVPGCNFLDLLALDKIPDPFDECNEAKVDWVAKQDWEYRRTFFLEEEDLQHDAVELHCEMLDTLCDVYINGSLAGKADNCFIAHSFPVKEYVKAGENEIRIYFHSPVNYVSEVFAKESAPRNSNGQDGIVHIRKPQCHFGWDWGPVLPPSGISGDVELRLLDGVQLEELQVVQEHENGTVRLSVSASTRDYSDLRKEETELEISLQYPDGTIFTQNGTSAEFLIENPQLWWTYELSGRDIQPLYTVRAVVKKGRQMTGCMEKKVGLRTIELNCKKDEYGQNFQFILNGVPLFIKGANYIPPDSFINRFTEKKLEKLLDSVHFSNMNMLRIWGGGFYGSDALYDACDRRGILLWQDFMFACQAYPFFKPKFLENVKKEIAYNVNRLCHHASLAIWCGNNEIESMHMAWRDMSEYIEWTETFFYHILEKEIRAYDRQTPYIPGSPTGSAHNVDMDSDDVGDTHLWAVWHGLQPLNYYRNRMTRFCSEFGFESLPDKKTICTFSHSNNPSLSDPVFLAHQKCNGGNDKMIYYIGSRFRQPKRFEDYIYLSQIAQMECVSDATEHWRRNKGRCNGSMYWQLNDCWPVCSWSSVDYDGNYKALQYAAHRFNAPVSVSIEDDEDTIKIYLLNDLTTPQKRFVVYWIFDFVEGIWDDKLAEVELGPLENRCIFTLDTRQLKKKYDPKCTGLAAVVYENEERYQEDDNDSEQQKFVLLDAEKNLKLPKAKLTMDVKQEGDHLEIHIKTKYYARFVQLESSRSNLPFSDNFFDIAPRANRTVTVPIDPNLTVEEQIAGLSVRSLCDVEPEKNRLKTAWMEHKVFGNPINVLSKLYYERQSTMKK